MIRIVKGNGYVPDLVFESVKFIAPSLTLLEPFLIVVANFGDFEQQRVAIL